MHIISLHGCALICAEGCLGGYISIFFPQTHLNSLVYFNIHRGKKYNFLLSFNCQFQDMNWQLCSSVFVVSLLESLLDKLAEILKLCQSLVK